MPRTIITACTPQIFGNTDGAYPLITLMRCGRLYGGRPQWKLSLHPGWTSRVISVQNFRPGGSGNYLPLVTAGLLLHTRNHSTDYPGRAVGQLGIVRLDYRRRSRHAD